jgi:hypothetical protein
VFPAGGGDVEWSKFVADDATAIAHLEELARRAKRPSVFVIATNKPQQMPHTAAIRS